MNRDDIRSQSLVFTLLLIVLIVLIVLAGWPVSTLQASQGMLHTGRVQVEESAPAANIQLPVLFSDDMIVQRNRYIPIWGTAEPGGVVEVVIGDDHQKTVVDEDGHWKLEMNPLPTGGPYTIEVIGEERITFQNVLSGEVWVASGQSNMEMPLAGWGQINNYEQEIAAADYPDIRLLQVKNATSPTPINELEVDGGKWRLCSPETIPEFSAVGYFFARNLHKNLGVPVGIIHSSWGGTVAEAWTSKPTLEEHFPEFDKAIASLQSSGQEEGGDQLYEPGVLENEQKTQSIDPGYSNGEPVFAGASFNDQSWQTMNVPTLWEETGLGNFDGVVWFRKTVDIPKNWAGNDLQLNLGTIDDQDVTWFAGQRVGSAQSYTQQRHYTIPGNLVEGGRQTITVRVVDTGGGGGIYGQPERLSLKLNETDSLSLAGPWKYRQAFEIKTINPNRPTVLYNAMIHPIIPYGMRGVIWYQGESNAGRAYQYRELFSQMIRDWRTNWGAGNFPFLFVQLANFMERNEQPVESDWAELREAQLMALSEPNTGMAVTIDIGNATDIHPKNKQDVGLRLALDARATVYGEQVAFSGPIYRHMDKVDGNKIRLSFKHVNGGLQAKGSDELKGFAIAGADKKFYWAEAEIVGDNIVVSSPEVENPVAVRYGWSANPECNLYNGAGLPASPFRTDDWQGVTAGNR